MKPPEMRQLARNSPSSSDFGCFDSAIKLEDKTHLLHLTLQCPTPSPAASPSPCFQFQSKQNFSGFLFVGYILFHFRWNLLLFFYIQMRWNASARWNGVFSQDRKMEFFDVQV